jgi:hypothetical protein
MVNVTLPLAEVGVKVGLVMFVADVKDPVPTRPEAAHDTLE